MASRLAIYTTIWSIDEYMCMLLPFSHRSTRALWYSAVMMASSPATLIPFWLAWQLDYDPPMVTTAEVSEQPSEKFLLSKVTHLLCIETTRFTVAEPLWSTNTLIDWLVTGDLLSEMNSMRVTDVHVCTPHTLPGQFMSDRMLSLNHRAQGVCSALLVWSFMISWKFYTPIALPNV